MIRTFQDTIAREAKRAIFTHGRIDDWFCKACSAALDIDKRPPMLITAKANGIKISHVILCPACLTERGSTEDIRQSVKVAWFEANPSRHDGDHVPGPAQLMIAGTRPSPELIDHITVEVF